MECPILFNGDMVRAILAGRKTQTRRIISSPADSLCEVRDLLWVRETFKYWDWTSDGEPFIKYKADGGICFCHKYDEDWARKLVDIWADLSSPIPENSDAPARDKKWRPSIHMPRWACRLSLPVIGVRAERLQDISEKDALAEGTMHWWENLTRVEQEEVYTGGRGPCGAFRDLWTHVYGAESWNANPWVWVAEWAVAS